MFSDAEFLLESMVDSVFTLDQQAMIVTCNQAATALTGYTKDELAGKSYSILSVDREDQFQRDYEFGLLAKKGKLVIEGWKMKKDGSRFWAESTLSHVTDETGKRISYLCVIRDTWDRKKKELELLEQEERHRLLVEAIRDYSIFMLDPQGVILTWNEGALNLNGYTANEIIGKPFSVLYTPGEASQQKPESDLQAAHQNGRFEQESWRVRKNGSVFWASVVLTSMVNQNNKLIGFSMVIRDLSERLKEEEMLRQSEERYRLLVEQVTDYAIFMLDERGRIVSWNEGAKRIKGYTAQDIIGKYFSIFYLEEEILKGKPSLELSVARSEGKYEEEGWRLRKDGSRFWANVVITAVYNNEKTLVGFSKVTRDLTGRKMVEQEIKETSEKYRQIARRMELINKELSNTNYELEQFNSVVSHDLQEPLRTIKSFLYLVDKGLDPEKDQQLKSYVGKSSKAADRMKDLIQALLSYSQINKVRPAFTYIQSSELVEKVMGNLRGAIDSAGAQVTFRAEQESIYGDSIQLEQLIQNLVANAIKFTDGRPPVVEIKCSMKEGHTQFSITDNGIGLDEESREKIFEVFRRLHTTRSYPGNGVGLAICKKVVERHKGSIWVESQPGSGSTFYFTLWQYGVPNPNVYEEI